MIWLKDSYHVLLVILLLLSIRYSFQWNSRVQYYFVFYLTLVVVAESLGLYFDKYLDVSNAWIYNVYLILTLIYFAGFFYLTYQLKVLKRIVVFLLTSFLIIYFLFVPNNFFSLKSDFAIRSTLILLIGLIWMCLIYFLDIIGGSGNVRLRSSFNFWVVMGIFVWSVMVWLRFAGMSFFNDYDKIFLFRMAGFVDIINLITYSLYLKALLCLKPTKK